MKAEKTRLGWIVTEGKDRYIETSQAEPTSRVLDGSADHGYAAEYVGHGQVDGVPVKAIYLLKDEDMYNDDVPHDDEGQYDWDTALEQGRLVVEIDNLTDMQWATLRATGQLS